jgi:hypothetical protein
MFDKAETQNAPASISIIVNGQVIGDKLMTAIIECVSCPECGYEHRVSAYWVKGSERLNPDFKEA